MKTIYQILSELHENDKINETKNVCSWYGATSVEDLKKDKKVTFKIPVSSFTNKDLLYGKKQLIVVLVDVEAFEKIDK